MILIAPDKFKGHFSASVICEIVASRLRASGYRGKLLCRPMSDGGEGAADMLLPGQRHCGTVPGIYFNTSTSLCVAVSSEIVGFEAFINSGIPLMHRSSIALGRAIPKDIPTYVAVGGTAIADGGAGFLQGLGARFYDHADRLITTPLNPATLHTISRADISGLARYSLTGVVDVEADLVPSLHGDRLSALDFALQKALPGEDIAPLGAALRHFHEVLGGSSRWDGAGGGLGYALASVAKAPCLSGAQLAVESINADWNDIDLVITGEGRVDGQTTRGGKLVEALYRHASARNVKVLVLYGAADSHALYPWMAQIDSDWVSEIHRHHIF